MGRAEAGRVTTTPLRTAAPSFTTRRWRVRAGLVELGLVVGLYLSYSLTRLVADDALTPAAGRARDLLRVERWLGLDLEHWLNRLFVDHSWLGLAGSFYYATAHYLVTVVVLVWLWRRGPSAYVPARRALMLATAVALVLYVLLPMAPPRLMDGYADVLQLSSAHGWWGGEASAPRGLGGYTNQLAAFPSMHAGWALWVAWVVQRESRGIRHRTVLRVLAWTHAVVTAVVIVGTGNHWVLDAVVGWIVVAAAVLAVRPMRLPRPTPQGGRVPSGPPSGR
jgi:hypothetical protein